VDPVGTSPIRPDGWSKVSGATRFVADLAPSGAWVGGTVRSPIPRGRIRRIEFDPAFDWSRVTRVTAAELPGPNVVALIRDDQPILARDEVRHVAEAVALIAAPDRATLREALAAVRLDLEELPPVLTIEEALAAERVIWGEANLLAEYHVARGDLEAGFARAETVVEETYRTGHQEHLYIEPNGMIATPRTDGGVEVVGSLQCPYYIQRALSVALGLPADLLVVRQAPTGGAFGGQEDFPSLLALHAALLALRCGRAVRMIYDRTEDIRATTKRHPSRVRHRTGILRDGTIVAAEIDIVMDGGAYTTLSPVVLSRGLLHAAGCYRVPNVSIHGRAVATNTPPNGAFRGFGAPQTLFAVERQMDRVAAELGIDPLELRRRNALRDGDTLPYGQVLPAGSCGASLVLEKAAELSRFSDRRAEIEKANVGGGRTRRGLGLALYHHGGGFTGAGEEKIAGRARVRYAEDGRFEVQTSNVEMGQGTATALPMIAAAALGVPLSNVRLAVPDTSVVPDSGPTVASRTIMIVGRIVADACADLRAKLLQRSQLPALPPGGLLEAAESYAREAGPLCGEAQYEPVADLRWDEKAYRGDAYKGYSWGATVIEVEVDVDTLEVRPERATVVVEIGRAVHPAMAAGQAEGGTLQAIGYGHLEEMKLDGGRFLNDRMATYIIPTALDTPEMRVALEGLPYERGPFGAKGIGELPCDGGAPALLSAIEHATGIRATRAPATPERLLEAGRAD
jgi:CO/xanthine dehydrogenase Mo-binding subunit